MSFNSVQLDGRQLTDLQCLLDGSYYPLTSYLNGTDYHSVITECRLSSGQVWPIPITLWVSHDKIIDLCKQHEIGSDHVNCDKQVIELDDTQQLTVDLRDQTFLPVAQLIITQLYKPSPNLEADKVYGTLDDNHPQVKRLFQQSQKQGWYISGKLTQLQGVQSYDFLEYRLTPQQVKQKFKDLGWTKIVGFQTRNPMHRSHFELTKLALNTVGSDAKLLLHPVVGDTQECDVDYITRCRCYKQIIKYYPENTAMLSLLNYSMRMGGPREALLHAIIRKNYGCTHFVVGRDHAGPSYKTKDDRSFYGPYDAQTIVKQYEKELGITVITIPNVQYVAGYGYYTQPEITSNSHLQSLVKDLSGTQLRNLLKTGSPIPQWYTFPDIAEILQTSYNQTKSGLCVYLVGLSGSGKSTIAQGLKIKLMEIYNRPITILDGDTVRTNLSQGLGFSRQDRSLNVRRIGYVASEIVKHGGIVICANIAPYEDDRQHNRQLISQYGQYLEVFVDTALEICQQRDVKGLYALAKAGKLKGMTGIDDPFEQPQQSNVIITDTMTIQQAIDKIHANITL